MGSNVWAACLLVFLAELLWFFGIHGSAVTASLLTALFATQAYENVELVTAGLPATHIVNSFFIDCFKGPRSLYGLFIRMEYLSKFPPFIWKKTVFI